MGVSLLQAIQYVTGGVTLAAFLGAVMLFAYRSRLQSKVNSIKALPEADRAPSLKALADVFQVDRKSTRLNSSHG